ncbi:MAG: hypothetical protein ACI4CA_01285 [Bacteroides sp.]
MKEQFKLHTPNRQTGFRIPEGYFEGLTQRVMDRLPEAGQQPTMEQEPAAGNQIAFEPQPTLWQKIRPWLYMAAMFTGAALIIRVASPSAEEKAAALAHEEAESQEIEYIENALDAAMMDDYSLYMYLAEDTNH